MTELGKRIASALIMAPLALAAAWVGGPAAAALILVLCLLVFAEWFAIVGLEQKLWLVLGLICVATVVLATAFLITPLMAIGLVAGLGLATAVLAFFRLPPRWWVSGLLYACALGVSLLLLLGTGAVGFEALIFVFLIVWATDIAAYFGGRTFGGPKLWPAVSPKKTWSGSISGALAATLYSLLHAMVMDRDMVMLAVVALLLTVASQAGDLFESGIKRRFSVKDSGHLIPGHGGFMDRIDGLVFAAVVAVLVGGLRAGFAKVAEGLLFW